MYIMFSNLGLSNEILGGDIEEDIYYEKYGGDEEFINQQDGSESDTSSGSDLESDDDIMDELREEDDTNLEVIGGGEKSIKKFNLPNIY